VGEVSSTRIGPSGVPTGISRRFPHHGGGKPFASTQRGHGFRVGRAATTRTSADGVVELVGRREDPDEELPGEAILVGVALTHREVGGESRVEVGERDVQLVGDRDLVGAGVLTCPPRMEPPLVRG
jgi:hypothetical protein